MQIYEITRPDLLEGIADLDLRRDPSAPRTLPAAKPSAMSDIYQEKLRANPAQAAFAQRMAQAQKIPVAQAQKTTKVASNVISTPTPQQMPPITIGSGPNAQIFINKGRGYVDQKTGAPMPPAIVKALGVQ